jgi:5-oxoprolinase (ATP-hydrolysing) subunit A
VLNSSRHRTVQVSLVDLNADLGESFGRWTLGDDDALIQVISSANVACGFHAGDPPTLRRSCASAAARGVAVGAQVSYRDLAGFGRRFLDVAPDDLADDVTYQLGALDAFARAAGTAITYLKPHGALYHAVITRSGQAGAVVEAVRRFDPGLAVLGAPGSQLLAAAGAAGLRTVTEAFADRAYDGDGTLVPRSQPGAVLTDPREIAERVVRLVTDGVVTTRDGAAITLDPVDSVCLHGDTPGAVAIATAVRSALEAAGVGVGPFAPPPAP